VDAAFAAMGARKWQRELITPNVAKALAG
jgi:hypothetical protein